MTLRPFKMPGDARVLAELIPAAFQYPENPAWSIQSDEVDSILDLMRSAERLWPLFAALSVVSPAIRDAFDGFIWEEDGRAVGSVNVGRQGAGTTWLISNVAVLPAYRRRGIARKLTEAAIGLVRQRGGRTVVLDVIAGNVPAYDLYRSLGFEHFSSTLELNCTGEVPAPAWSSGFTLVPRSAFAWRPEYELARRITPAGIQRYRPVEAAGLRLPVVLRPPVAVLMSLSGMSERRAAVHVAAPGAAGDRAQVVATVHYTARRRAGGFNQCELLLDPAHAALAPCLVGYALHAIQRVSPGRRIQLAIQSWQDALVEAARAAGCKPHVELNNLGLAL
jgi:ribosomal protein S18 acetylase RimI-like enzyme